MIGPVKSESLPGFSNAKCGATRDEFPVMIAPDYLAHFTVGRPPRGQGAVVQPALRGVAVRRPNTLPLELLRQDPQVEGRVWIFHHLNVFAAGAPELSDSHTSLADRAVRCDEAGVA